MKLISQRAYARHRGIHTSSVQEMVDRGRIPTHAGPRGWRWVNVEEADRALAENTDPSAPRNSQTGAPRHRRDPSEPETPMDLDGRVEGGGNGRDKSDKGNGAATGFSKARAAREVYTAQLKKLELDRETGTLVRKDAVTIAAFNLARQCRDQLQAIPERMATTLAATEDPAEVQRMLEDEVERICEELSDAGAS